MNAPRQTEETERITSMSHRFARIHRVFSVVLRGVHLAFHALFHIVVFGPPVRLLFKVTIIGAEKLPRRGGILITSNHQHELDPVILAVFIWWRSLCFLAKEELWKIPVFGPLLSLAGQIRLSRQGGELSLVGLRRAVKLIKQRGTPAIFPEGTRSRNGKMKKGKTGAMYIAYVTGRPVYPVGIIGMDGVRLTKLRPWRRARVLLVVGDPIMVPQTLNPTQVQLSESTHQLMEAIADVSMREYVAKEAA